MTAQAEGLRGQLATTLTALQHLDATIMVFKPDIELSDLPVGMPTPPFAGFRGEIVRFILDLLREANGPLDTFQIAERVMQKRGLDPADRLHFKLIAKRTGYALAKLRKAGTVTSRRAHRSAPLEWETV